MGPFGFAGAAGYQEDADSGLKLLGHRYYDPSTGRFLTRDTAQDGRNWYAYCDSNPLRAVDPEGLYILVLRSDGGHTWIAVYKDNGELYHTYGLWTDGRHVDIEQNRGDGDASIAIHVDHYKVNTNNHWTVFYNCVDYAEDMWEMNGGDVVYHGMLWRLPDIMVDRIKSTKSPVKAPTGGSTAPSHKKN